jgi:hypothetical protein
VKPDLRRVNRDVLVPLRLQRIHQVRPFKRNAAPFGHFLELFQFSFRQRAGIMKQTADKRRFAMVHMAHNHYF